MAKKRASVTRVTKKVAATSKSKLVKKTPPKKVASKKPAVKKKSSGKKRGSAGPALGRPLVTGEEMLFMLFKEDYHARQIFDFLRVQRVKELEEFSPDEIVGILSQPITETVNRIRRKLAEKNRALKNDASFAIAARNQ